MKLIVHIESPFGESLDQLVKDSFLILLASGKTLTDEHLRELRNTNHTEVSAATVTAKFDWED